MKPRIKLFNNERMGYTMEKASKKYVEVTEELKTLLVSELVNANNVENMSENEFELMKVCLKFIDASNDLITKQACMLSDMSERLDMIYSTVAEGNEA